MSEFTKGPWKVGGKFGTKVLVSENVLADMWNIPGPGGIDEGKANARLISTAPDMYEALRELMSSDDTKQCHFCSKSEWGEEKHDSNCPLGMAYLALRKATGESTDAPGA